MAQTDQVVLGVVMDPIADITYKKDTTLALLLAAKKRGWKIKYMHLDDLFLRQGKPYALMSDLDVFADPVRWYDLGTTQPSPQPLADLDVLLMRKDPPFDQAFLTSTWLLEAAEREGVLVANKPQSLRDFNEKLFAQEFPECCPPTLVASQDSLIREFHQEHGDIILKPLDGMGGMGVFRVKEDGLNLGAIIEQLTAMGQRQIMVQKYLPEIKEGDTRILLIDGEPQPYGLARIPQAGETRGNLAAGGNGVARKLTDRDYWLVKQVAPVLKERGLIFVGLDVIGDYLTEINVTSPTCVRELDQQCGLDIGGDLMAHLAERLGRG
ncbi:glutathione synthase [Marinospirillum perlucidum]|uniref:glutathione synthase n=1 Tax=Marinospirillum perlucidum TaxID=1982602 RepID=UPI000DF29754|nr:glutathione synthase [Marinospirillum perlucidum]